MEESSNADLGHAAHTHNLPPIHDLMSTPLTLLLLLMTYMLVSSTQLFFLMNYMLVSLTQFSFLLTGNCSLDSYLVNP